MANWWNWELPSKSPLRPAMNTRARCWRRRRSWNLPLSEAEHLLLAVSRCILAKLRSLQPQQERLGRQAAAVATQPRASRQHSVTRDDNRNRIEVVGLPDGAESLGASH